MAAAPAPPPHSNRTRFPLSAHAGNAPARAGGARSASGARRTSPRSSSGSKCSGRNSRRLQILRTKQSTTGRRSSSTTSRRWKSRNLHTNGLYMTPRTTPGSLGHWNKLQKSRFTPSCRSGSRPTPLGSYNPDWAILFVRDGMERLYLVVETKAKTFDWRSGQDQVREEAFRGYPNRRFAGAVRGGHGRRGALGASRNLTAVRAARWCFGAGRTRQGQASVRAGRREFSPAPVPADKQRRSPVPEPGPSQPAVAAPDAYFPVHSQASTPEPTRISNYGPSRKPGQLHSRSKAAPQRTPSWKRRWRSGNWWTAALRRRIRRPNKEASEPKPPTSGSPARRGSGSTSGLPFVSCGGAAWSSSPRSWTSAGRSCDAP